MRAVRAQVFIDRRDERTAEKRFNVVPGLRQGEGMTDQELDYIRKTYTQWLDYCRVGSQHMINSKHAMNVIGSLLAHIDGRESISREDEIKINGRDLWWMFD